MIFKKDKQIGFANLYKKIAKNGNRFYTGNAIIVENGVEKRVHIKLWPKPEGNKIKENEIGAILEIYEFDDKFSGSKTTDL